MSEDCARVADFLAQAAGLEISAELAAHAALCSACQEQIEAHRQLGGFQRTPVPELSPGFAQRVTRLAVAQQQAAPLGTKGRIIEAAYAMACVAVIGVLLRATSFNPPRVSLPVEILPWLVPAGFALAMALPAMLRAARRVVVQILA